MSPSERALARLRHWSRVLVLRVFGTTLPPAQTMGWIGLFDEVLSQRAEFDALKLALLGKGVVGEERYLNALEEMADANSAILATFFVGAVSTDTGMEVTDRLAWAKTTEGWPT